MGAAADAAARGLPAARGGLEPARVRNKPTSAPLGHPDRNRGRKSAYNHLDINTDQGPGRAGVQSCAPSARRRSPTSREQQPEVQAETLRSPSISRQAEVLLPCWPIRKMLLEDKDDDWPLAVRPLAVRPLAARPPAAWPRGLWPLAAWPPAAQMAAPQAAPDTQDQGQGRGGGLTSRMWTTFLPRQDKGSACRCQSNLF